MKIIINIVLMILPWRIRRWCLQKIFGYELHPTSRIGLSIIIPKKLIMGANSRIYHFNVCRNIEKMALGEYAIIGRLNWVSGTKLKHQKHFRGQRDRQPELIMGSHSSITSRHIFDCTNLIKIGKFSTIAGYRSQFITHGIDLKRNVQSSGKIEIGNYCFIGTNSTILRDSYLPDFSVLGACSLLNKKFKKNYFLYTGTPALPYKELPKNFKYFLREDGYVE